MKRILMAATITAGLWTAPANSQVAVIDNASLLQAAKSYFNDLKQYAVALQQLQQQVQTAESTYQTVQGLIQNPSMGTALGLMNMAGLQSALPVNAYSVQSLVSGYGGLQSKLGALSTLSNSSFGSSSIYTCTDNSWACQQLQQRAAGNAGQQAIGMNAIQTAAAHLPVLQAIRDRLATATTPAERENAMGALQTETAWATQENTRLMAANILITSQNDIRQQQADEQLHQGFDTNIARYRAAVGQ